MSPRTEYENHSTSTSWETLAKRTAFSKAGPLFTLSLETVAELAWPSPGQPLPPSPLRDLCDTPARPPRRDRSYSRPGDSNRVRSQFNQGEADLYPLLGERQIPPSPAEIGEGSSGHPASGYARVSVGRGLR